MAFTPGDSYKPSNGTEGSYFIDKYCANCIHEKWIHTPEDDDAKKCEILSATFVDNDFSQWVYNNQGKPTCKCFKKWDWGFDDGEGGGLNEPQPPEPYNPRQLVMPFLTNEILHEHKTQEYAEI